jgi:hypothetical protein
MVSRNNNWKDETMTPLQTELQLPTYAALSNADAASLFQAAIVIGRKALPIGSFITLLFRGGIWAKLVICADTPQTTDQGNQLRAAAISVVHWCSNKHVETVAMDDPEVKAALAALVAGNLIPQALLTQIDALADVTTTRGAQLGYRQPITAAMIAVARSAES